MNLGEGVCPYTPPRVYPLTIMEESKNFKTINAEFPYQFQIDAISNPK
jgi:hypothetical protein